MSLFIHREIHPPIYLPTKDEVEVGGAVAQISREEEKGLGHYRPYPFPAVLLMCDKTPITYVAAAAREVGLYVEGT